MSFAFRIRGYNNVGSEANSIEKKDKKRDKVGGS
jgi:hypothetical protein